MRIPKNMTEKEQYLFIKNIDKYQDKYGNNINFPDHVVSDMTIKGLLGKWTFLISNKIKCALYKYHFKTRNIDAGDKPFVETLFQEVYLEVHRYIPILEDCVAIDIFGITAIFEAVFGSNSDEVYALNIFLDLYHKMKDWKTKDMWTDCDNDARLLKILTH